MIFMRGRNLQASDGKKKTHIRLAEESLLGGGKTAVVRRRRKGPLSVSKKRGC